MKSLFPGLAIICGTALLIAGNTTSGIVFAVLGFLGAIAGAAIRQQNEQEAIAVMKEFTEAFKKNSTNDDQIAEMQEAIGQLVPALGQIWSVLTTPNDFDGGGGGFKH